MKSLHAISLGFALFSMFFGAGNLVVPLKLGVTLQNPAELPWGILGLILTGVLIPFLGLAATLATPGGDYRSLFAQMGSRVGFCLLLMVQLLLGPLGVIPRLFSLMYETSKPFLFGYDNPLIFSLGVGGVVCLFSYRSKQITAILGFILTPFLLGALALLMLSLPWNNLELGASFALEPFSRGLLEGYQTMDLLAAFLFGSAVIPEMARFSSPGVRLVPPLLAALLLAFIYSGLVFLSNLHGTQNLGAIALAILGPRGQALSALIVVLACLTTAISLSSLFSVYLSGEIFQNKATPTQCLILSQIVAVLFSLLGIQAIMEFLLPILKVLYPGLIVLSGIHIYSRLKQKPFLKSPVYLSWALSLIWELLP
jgi:LIVCS family branched-chain amino acid:cation transporter